MSSQNHPENYYLSSMVIIDYEFVHVIYMYKYIMHLIMYNRVQSFKHRHPKSPMRSMWGLKTTTESSLLFPTCFGAHSA